MNRTISIRILILLVVLILFARSIPAWAETLSFEQLNWIGLDSSTPNSSWGRLTYEFEGYSGLGYFNLNVNGDWVIANMSVVSLYGEGVSQKLMAMFDLGVADGTDVVTLDYVYSIDGEPLLAMPTGDYISVTVAELDYRIGSEDEIDLGTPDAVDRGPISFVYVTHSAQLPEIDKFINQPQGGNECVPAAISNSLKYLQATGKINFSEEIEDVKYWVDWVGFGTPSNWYLKKKDYLEEKDMTVRFIEAPLTRSKILDLLTEIAAGQDVEMDLYGHAEDVVGVRLKSDNTVELDLFDDNQGDGKADPMHTATFSLGDPSVIDGRTFERFVVECPAPEPEWSDWGWKQRCKLTASDGVGSDYFGEAVAIDGDYAIIGAYRDDDKYSDGGAAYIFKASDDLTDPNWYEQCKLLASDGAGGDWFGCSVGISGDYAIIGAYRDDDNGSFSSGSACIFKASSDPTDPNWYEQAKLTASDGAAGDSFGYAVAISGDYAIVGAPNDSLSSPRSGEGSAYIFKRNGLTWSQQTKLTASDANFSDRFGFSVAIHCDYAIVGAWTKDGDAYASGAAYIFKRSGYPNDPNWYQEDKLISSDSAAQDYFGISVSIYGERALVGAHGNDHSGKTDCGAAYMFENDGTMWQEVGKLTAQDAGATDAFGYSVSLTEDYAIVSSHLDNYFSMPDCGAVYIFKCDDFNRSHQMKFRADDGFSDDNLGFSVAISGDYAIAGAHWDDDIWVNSGSAYIFDRFCPTADLSGDCCVDCVDLSIIVANWLKSDCGVTVDCGGADLDSSLTVNFGDVSILAAQWLLCD